MEKGAILNFFDAAMTDQELHKKFTELAEEFVELAEKYGYDFTVEELVEFGSAQPMLDDDVSSISGGVPRFNPPTPRPPSDFGL